MNNNKKTNKEKTLKEINNFFYENEEEFCNEVSDKNVTDFENLLVKFLKPMLKFNIDHLVLGCTHYPYLIPQIKKIVGEKVSIIDSGEAVAKQTKAVLKKHHLLNQSELKPKHLFFTNGNKKVLAQFVAVKSIAEFK